MYILIVYVDFNKIIIIITEQRVGRRTLPRRVRGSW